MASPFPVLTFHSIAFLLQRLVSSLQDEIAFLPLLF